MTRKIENSFCISLALFESYKNFLDFLAKYFCTKGKQKIVDDIQIFRKLPLSMKIYSTKLFSEL